MDFSLFVVDNNSNDGTVEFLKSQNYPNITIYENKENSGVAGGRNIGIQLGKSEYIICLDNDQFVCPNWLDDLFAIHKKGYDIVGIDAWLMAHPKTHKPYFPVRHCKTKFDNFTYVGGGGTLIPRKIWDEIGPYDENYSPFYFEDSDWFFRFSQKGYRAMWHYNNKVLHLGHQTGSKQKDFSLNAQFKKSYDYFVKKWKPYFPNPISAITLDRTVPEIFRKDR